jgi:hypothetical protein
VVSVIRVKVEELLSFLEAGSAQPEKRKIVAFDVVAIHVFYLQNSAFYLRGAPHDRF